jgi:hypothetical protein
VDRLLEPPVIVATSLAAARHLLGDDTLGWDSGRAMLLDLGYAGWRDRQVWRRQAIANARSGALDLPGRTWPDRPRVERGDDPQPAERVQTDVRPRSYHLPAGMPTGRRP